MSRGLHLLGYDWMKGASSMTAAFADNFSRDAAKRPDAAQMALAQQLPEESSTVWYIGGAAVLAVLVVLLVRSR